jgi:anhydro-N-acetylmuramic acid kinase
MKGLAGLASKKSLLVLGLMSGTSVDGLDLGLCHIAPDGKGYRVRLLNTGFCKYPESLRTEIIGLASQSLISKARLITLDQNLARFYARKITAFMRKNKINHVDLIGSHGQTIYHADVRLKAAKAFPGGTLQIGNGAILAALTGIPVVSDFRASDIALGGSGAPLTPVCHYHLFAERNRNIAVLNIGGITNLTWLPKRAGLDSVRASDCGPGNMIIDYLSRKLFKKRFDSGGKIALSGKVDNKLLDSFRREAWFKAFWPKSLGREQFGSDRIDRFITAARGLKLSKEDTLATASELTVVSVYRALREYDPPSALIISGGGVHNRYFMKRFAEILPACKIAGSGAWGIDPDYVEAAAFALLAAMFVYGDPANLPQVTGAGRKTILGKLSMP